MITPKVTGAIITALVIVLGIALLFPALKIDTRFAPDKDANLILLTFNIINSSNMPDWCYDLSQYLKSNKIQSTVFMPGIIADSYPDCVSSFSNNTDIGSSGYRFDKITAIPGYLDELNQIKQGKKAIDRQGKINSTLFRAPYGAVDDNIYSLLARSQIVGDFSYDDHYNIYTDGASGKTFYKYPMVTLNNIMDLSNMNDPKTPVVINFYNGQTVEDIEQIINSTSKFPHKFRNPSELLRMDLTIR